MLPNQEMLPDWVIGISTLYCYHFVNMFMREHINVKSKRQCNTCIVNTYVSNVLPFKYVNKLTTLIFSPMFDPTFSNFSILAQLFSTFLWLFYYYYYHSWIIPPGALCLLVKTMVTLFLLMCQCLASGPPSYIFLCLYSVFWYKMLCFEFHGMNKFEL